MHILSQRPPNYDQLKEAFGFNDKKIVYFTYGNIIYNPHGKSITDDLIRHEQIHGEQQQYDPLIAKLWWERYLIDPEWRIEQEGEAYGAQYDFICQKVKDRNLRVKYLHKFAEALSGPLYGNVISHSEATIKIKEYADLGRPAI